MSVHVCSETIVGWAKEADVVKKIIVRNSRHNNMIDYESKVVSSSNAFGGVDWCSRQGHQWGTLLLAWNCAP